MPWTPSHAAAILPLRRLCPKYLSFPALVAGALAPDMGYYVRRFDVSDFAHTFVGSIVVCIPVGLLSLLLFFLLRRPLWFLLPQPHRSALEPLVAERPVVDARSMLVATVSIVIGAWTHLFWDSFTHSKTWIVDRVDWLSDTRLRIGPIQVYGFTILQDLSTLVGAIALSVVYMDWLRKQPKPLARSGSDRWRYFMLIGTVLLSVAIAMILALDATAAARAPLRVFVVQTAFYSGSAFAALLLVYSAGYFLLCDRKAQVSEGRKRAVKE